MKNFHELIASLLKPGTQSMIAGGLLGLVVAILLLTLGFWKTLLIVVCCALGCFLFGVKDKRSFLRNLIRSISNWRD